MTSWLDSVGNSVVAVHVKTDGLYGPLETVALAARSECGDTSTFFISDPHSFLGMQLLTELQSREIVTFNSYYTSHVLMRDIGVALFASRDPMLFFRLARREEHTLQDLAMQQLQVVYEDEEGAALAVLLLDESLQEQTMLSSGVWERESMFAAVQGQQAVFGVRVDQAMAVEIVQTMQSEYQAIEQKLGVKAKSFGIDKFSTASAPKVAKLLYDCLSLPCTMYTDKGKPSTSQEALAPIVDSPYVGDVIRARSLASRIRLLATIAKSSMVFPTWSTVQPSGTLNTFASAPNLGSCTSSMLNCLRPPGAGDLVWIGYSASDLALRIVRDSSGSKTLAKCDTMSDFATCMGWALDDARTRFWQFVQDGMAAGMPEDVVEWAQQQAAAAESNGYVECIGGYLRSVTHLPPDEQRKRGVRTYIHNSLAVIGKHALLTIALAALGSGDALRAMMLLPAGAVCAVPQSVALRLLAGRGFGITVPTSLGDSHCDVVDYMLSGEHLGDMLDGGRASRSGA